MRKIFNIADYPGKYAMHCDTEEKAKGFCGYLDSVGKKWINGDSYASETNWLNKHDGKETYYSFNEGRRFFLNKYIVEDEYAILEFDDFKFPTSSEMKVMPVKASRLIGQACYLPKVKNVIFNPPATIVNWSDGTKTVVKCDRCRGKSNGECKHCMKRSSHWKENGLSCAFAKKAFGNEYFEAVKKYCE